MNAIANQYIDGVISLIEGLKSPQNMEMIHAAFKMILDALETNHQLYVFGTGHSHMIAEEILYRAGGLACAIPILSATTMLHEGAVSSSQMERTSGIMEPIIKRYNIQSGDVLIVVSNSGVNAAPVEAAEIGKRLGAKVIALTSIAYSSAIAKGRKRLTDIADLTIDNGIEPGDAIIKLEGSDLKTGPASTAVCATIINAIVTEVACALAKNGEPPVFRSANMQGAAEINIKLIEKYGRRNPHLR